MVETQSEMFIHHAHTFTKKITSSIYEYAINNNIDFKIFSPCVITAIFDFFYQDADIELRQTILSHINKIAKDIDKGTK
jgi:hypothetical protein